jgi:hypothetical protein
MDQNSGTLGGVMTMTDSSGKTWYVCDGVLKPAEVIEVRVSPYRFLPYQRPLGLDLHHPLKENPYVQ